jgi:DNA-binding NtrC family response regulator
MPRVQLSIADPTQRMTLRTMLEVDGHEVVAHAPDVLVCDTDREAVSRATEVPTLLLAGAADIGRAVEAMRKGVWDYLFVPFQSGEATLKVRRAANSNNRRSIDDAPLEQLPSLDAVEREHVMRVLRKCKHNQAKAARILGIGRNTLWRKLKKWNEETGAS